jgi:hypothetical protein
MNISRTTYILTPASNEALLASQGKIAPGKKRSVKRGWAAFFLDSGTRKGDARHVNDASQVNDLCEVATVMEERKGEMAAHLDVKTMQVHDEAGVVVISARRTDGKEGEIILYPVLPANGDDSDGLDEFLGINQEVRRSVVPSAPAQRKKVAGDRVQLWKGGPWFPVNPEVLKRDAEKARKAFARC